jgi:ribonucleoside-diphosphate reductase alpha chain
MNSVTSKVRYMGPEGWKTVYLSISFARVDGSLGGQSVCIDRPLEFFMPAGQRDEGQQWISSNMRLLSLVARSGEPLSKALQNMREVVWDKGPVRCGELTKDDGSRVPRFHQSEVAAIAYALQGMLQRQGFLDTDGGQLPADVLARRRNGDSQDFELDELNVQTAPEAGSVTPIPTGKPCPDCGGPYLRKVDGCERCDHCGFVGSCG